MTVSRLLIVDDDVEILALLKQFFVQHGYEVDLAAEGQAMWAAIARQRPDAIILDLMLPGEGGLDLCQKLRAQLGVPVIMLTAMAELSDRIIGLELGADDYLTKPFDLDELLARVRALTRRSARPAGDPGRPAGGAGTAGIRPAAPAAGKHGQGALAQSPGAGALWLGR